MSVVADPKKREMIHRGGVRQLRREFEAIKESSGVLEYLVEGPRGTGKSNGVAYLLWKLCYKTPGLRVLVIRSSRSLLTDTFCKTYEEDICPGHMSIGKIARTQRHEYYFAKTKARIVLGGLDEPVRYYGSDWDIIVVEEAVELSWKEIEPFLGSLRNNKLPFHALIYLTNPDAPTHWLNKRANAGLCRRLRCQHRDNPSLFDWDTQDWNDHGRSFLASLSKYTGAAYGRHVLGEWTGAEGGVWENFNEALHVIDDPDWRTSLGIVEYRGSMDWGSTHPGVFQVWGIDGDKRMTLVATIQRVGKTPDWWSQQVVDLADEFQIRRIVCDPSQPSMIKQFNEWLSKRKLAQMAYPANNKKASSGGDMGGLALVRWGFEKDETGTPRIRFLRGALRGGADPALVQAGKPTWVVEEVPSYVHDRDATGEILLEQTDKDCADDGCDAMRYQATDNWTLKPQAPPPAAAYVWPEWTNAGRFGTPHSLERASLRKDEGTDDGYA